MPRLHFGEQRAAAVAFGHDARLGFQSGEEEEEEAMIIRVFALAQRDQWLVKETSQWHTLEPGERMPRRERHAERITLEQFELQSPRWIIHSGGAHAMILQCVPRRNAS